MTLTTDRYINLFTDFGFKKLFGESPNKESERSVYEDSLKDYRDLISAIDTYYKDGKKDREVEIAIESLKEGLPLSTISKITGLDMEELEKLKEAL